ncbi:MAG: response regulator transcription factor, partial [Bacteroidia bacterium]|nr:response regulator transcription factor [Bacteroidia bacterium]
MTLRAIAIDDEPLALEILSRHCQKLPGVELVETFQNPMLGVTYLQENTVDLVFVDIQMPDLNGLQLLKTLSDPPLVIFTTAHPEYALDSYELNAVDYLLKPISFERLLKAVIKAQELRKGQMALLEKEEAGDDKKDFLFVKSDTRFFKIYYNDIHFIEGMRDYVAIHTGQQRVLTLTSMTNMVKRLPSDMFMRVH